jgi:hypothetical protein
MQLPDCYNAVVDVEKLRQYCLNPEHLEGRRKARVFRAVLGVTREHADWLRYCLLFASCGCDATLLNADDYGARYVLDASLEHQHKEAVVRSVWLVPPNDVPRLVTCFVLHAGG